MEEKIVKLSEQKEIVDVSKRDDQKVIIKVKTISPKKDPKPVPTKLSKVKPKTMKRNRD